MAGGKFPFTFTREAVGIHTVILCQPLCIGQCILIAHKIHRIIILPFRIDAVHPINRSLLSGVFKKEGIFGICHRGTFNIDCCAGTHYRDVIIFCRIRHPPLEKTAVRKTEHSAVYTAPICDVHLLYYLLHLSHKLISAGLTLGLVLELSKLFLLSVEDCIVVLNYNVTQGKVVLHCLISLPERNELFSLICKLRLFLLDKITMRIHNHRVFNCCHLFCCCTRRKKGDRNY